MAFFVETYDEGTKDFINLDLVTRFIERDPGDYIFFTGSERLERKCYDLSSLLKGKIIQASDGQYATAIYCFALDNKRPSDCDVYLEKEIILAWVFDGMYSQPIYIQMPGKHEEGYRMDVIEVGGEIICLEYDGPRFDNMDQAKSYALDRAQKVWDIKQEMS